MEINILTYFHEDLSKIMTSKSGLISEMVLISNTKS